MAVKLEATGNTIADAITSLGCPDLIAASLDTETLLAETRERFAREGQVVKIVSFEDNSCAA
jgi:hypothetical protein